MSSSIFTKGAIVISIVPSIGTQHDCDILIEGDRISAVGKNLKTPAGADVFDGTDCIITPGIVDGHHHM